MGHVVRMTATGALGITFVFLVDAANLLWILQLGQPKLVAAIGFAWAIQFFSVSIGVGLMIAVTALISRSIGEGQRNLARSQAGAGIVIAAVVQGSVALLILFFRLELVQLAGAEGKNALDAARYLGLTIMSLVPMAIGLTCSGALRAESLGTKAMYVTLISGLLLMIVDPILIIGLGWGLDGAGIGLVLFRFALAGLGLFFAAYQHQLISMPTRRALGDALGPYVAVAGPAIVTQMAIPAGNYFLTRVMAPFGDDAVAAWAVVARLAVLSLSVHCSCLMRPLTIWANLGAVRLLIGSKMAS
jgi:Na+-driven multidrug efflux pump